MSRKILVLVLSLFIVHSISGQERSISGRIILDSKHGGEIIIQLYRLKTSGSRVYPLSKADIYGAAKPLMVKRIPDEGEFYFDGLDSGYYSIVAFQDSDQNGKVSFDPPEPFGWFFSGEGYRFSPIDLTKSDRKDLKIYLRVPTHFDKRDRIIDHGALRWIKGLPVLQLWGGPSERGFAHGYLVARQIIDFFEYYILEDSWQSSERYQNIFVPFLENQFNYPREFLEECKAVIRGMKASGVDMKVEFLNRDFCLTDLLAINCYIERRAAFLGTPASSCTQFAFWGDLTSGGELKGGLVAARNMDGECDVRKVTVSHFLLFAVDPSLSGKKRWISAMWPGFVGTISGINEDGIYSMENAGGTGPGPVPDGIVPCSFIQKFVLENSDKRATPETVLGMMKKYICSTGGITAAGSIILWAMPYTGQENPAFVFEGSRTGYAVRLPDDVRPKDRFNIMASNHHRVLGYDPDHPDYSLGRRISFSSRWRYEVGKQTLEAWSRENKILDIEDAKRLLQSVAHGTTEYSVIFSANQMRILVAVDDLKPDLWDAPYMKWVELGFDELFAR